MVENVINKELVNEEQNKTILEHTGFDVLLFDKMIDLQKNLNIKVHKNWMDQEFNWDLAMLLESAELLDSFDWKWWKKGSTDWKNAEIEMVDIFLFLLAKGIENNVTDMIKGLLISQSVQDNKITPIERNSKDLIENIQNGLALAITNKNLLQITINWINIWNKLGFSVKDLFIKFSDKQVLNNFRQDHGYKTGDYIKIWNDEEDNSVLQRISSDLDFDDTYDDRVYKLLEEEYSKIDKHINKSVQKFIDNDPKWKAFISIVPEENLKVILEFAEELKTYLEK